MRTIIYYIHSLIFVALLDIISYEYSSIIVKYTILRQQQKSKIENIITNKTIIKKDVFLHHKAKHRIHIYMMNSLPEQPPPTSTEEEEQTCKCSATTSCCCCRNNTGITTISERAIVVEEAVVSPTLSSDVCTPPPTTSSSSTTDTTSSNQTNTISANISKPKYPRTAYNCFFQYERNRIFLYGIHHTTHTIPLSICRLDHVVLYENENQSDSSSSIKTFEQDEERNVTERLGDIVTTQISFTDLVRTIGRKWKALDASSKEYFEEKANNDKIRYHTELQRYNNKSRRYNNDTNNQQQQEEVSTH